MREFLSGALTVAAWVAGMFFLRFWRATRDRFFCFLAVAFWTLAATWAALGLSDLASDTRSYIYLMHAGAFVLIICGAVDKNRRARVRAQ